MQQVRAKKSLGQHFLIDLDVAQRIAATIEDYKHLPTLEVGPGMGVLTQYLLHNGHDLKVVELDGESVEYLKVHFPALDRAPVQERGEDVLWPATQDFEKLVARNDPTRGVASARRALQRHLQATSRAAECGAVY